MVGVLVGLVVHCQKMYLMYLLSNLLQIKQFTEVDLEFFREELLSNLCVGSLNCPEENNIYRFQFNEDITQQAQLIVLRLRRAFLFVKYIQFSLKRNI